MTKELKHLAKAIKLLEAARMELHAANVAHDGYSEDYYSYAHAVGELLSSDHGECGLIALQKIMSK